MLSLVIVVLLVASLAAGCGSIGGGGEGAGGSYPNKEIEFIVPFDAGSAPDSTFRQLSDIAEDELGQSIVIVNRPGGGGTVGTTEIINANPDGYRIGVSAVAVVTIKPETANTAYQGPDELQAILQPNVAPVALFVRADSGMETIDDFVQRAKEEQGALTIGIPGAYSILDLEVDLLKRDAGIELEEVVHDAGKQVPAVVNGTIDAGVAQPAPLTQYVDRGDLRILGVFGEQKPEGLEAPLFSEAGYDITEIPYEFVVGPKDMPAERVQVIHDAYKAAMESQAFQDYVSQQKVIAEYVGTEDLQQKLERDHRAHAEYIEELGWGTGQVTVERSWIVPSLLVGLSLLAVLAIAGAVYRYRVAGWRSPAFRASGDRDSATQQEGREEAATEETTWEPSSFARLLLLAVPLVVGVTYLIQTLSYPFGSIGGPDFGFFPMLVGALIVGASAVVLLRQGTVVLRKGATGKKGAETEGAEVRPEDTAGFRWKLLLIMAALLVYVLVANIAGHIVTAAFVSAVALKLTGGRPWWQVVLFGVAIGVGSYLLFAVILGMPLPTGVLLSS
jgi:putative tricarboxylic transport membrane protein